MSKFNIGDKVISKRYPYLGEELGVIVGIDTRENAFGKYLVKFDSLELSEGLSYRDFVNNIINNTYCITEPYEGYAIWLEEEDLTKVEEECEEEKCKEGEVYMSKLNIGDKVVSNDDCYSGKEVGIIVGIDPKAKASGKYLVKFDSIKGLEYELFCNNPNLIIEPYEGYAMWLDDLIKVKDEYEKGECEEKCEKDKHEEDIKMEFDKIREEKKEVIKGISEKILEMTLEIKEMEHEIEKIKKEWHLE